MNEEVKAFNGLGFCISEIDLHERADFPCDFHKLDEEVHPFPCPETPYIFFGLDADEGGLSMCRRHYDLFVSDMLVSISCMSRGEACLPHAPEMIHDEEKEAVITRTALTETVMRVKDKLNPDKSKWH